jgi:uracil-DNA glycosylase family 4
MSPGTSEDMSRDAAPFIGKAGRELDRLLASRLVRLPRPTVWVSNLNKCHTPNDREPKVEETEACSRWLYMEISALRNLRVVGALGKPCASWFLGRDVSMDQEHGIPQLAYVDLGGIGDDMETVDLIIVPVYHPAAGLREPMNWIYTQDDLAVVALLAREGWRALWPMVGARVDEWEGEESYRLLQGYGPVDSYLGDGMTRKDRVELDGEVVVSVDTEANDEGGPWCIQVSVAEGEGMMVRADDEMGLRAVNDHLAREGVLTVLHNALYDVPIMQDLGMYPRRIGDTMSMAYLIQSEPQGLKPLAFRHRAMVMQDYSEVVAEATRLKAIWYLSRVVQQDWPDPEAVLVPDEKKGGYRWKQPQNIGKKAGKILEEEWTKGADPWTRWHNIKHNEGRGDVEEFLGPMRPGALHDIPLEEALHYACRDSDATIRVAPGLYSRVVSLGLDETFWRDMRAMHMVVDMTRTGILADEEWMRGMSGELQRMKREKEEEIRDQVTRCEALALQDWLEGNRRTPPPQEPIKGDVNPGSAPQVYKLLFEDLGVRWTGKGEPSTNDKVLARIAEGSGGEGGLPEADRVVQLIRDWRGLNKLQTSYADALPQRMDSDGRVRSKIRMTRTATGRLSSSDPNLMAIPTRTKLGRQIRMGFVAPDGCSLLSVDYSQVEMRVAASDAEDDRMIRVFNGGQDIHTQTAAMMFGLDERDVKEKEHRYPAKRVGFGILNDITADGLQRELVMGGADEADWPVSECQAAIDAWFDVYRGIARYMKANREFALRNGYVVDMWDRRRFVPGVHAKDRQLREESLRAAGNAPIQMGAQGVIKQAMGDLVPYYRQVRAEGWTWNPLIQIHDDILMEMSDEILEWTIPLIVGVMESAGEGRMKVALEVEPKVGRRWGEMEDWW